MSLRKVIAWVGATALVMGVGCADFGWIDLRYQPGVGTKDSGIARLQRISSPDAWVDYFRDQVMAQRNREDHPIDDVVVLEGDADVRPLVDAVPPPASPGGQAADNSTTDGGALSGDRAAGPEDFSSTNIQVLGVDESDVVKTDGQYFYMLAGSQLRIIRAFPADQMAEVGRVDMTVDGWGQELYLHDGKVVVLQQSYAQVLDGPKPGPITPGIPVDPIAIDVDGAGSGVSNGGGSMGDAGVDERGPLIVADAAIGFFPQYYQDRAIVTVVDVSNPLEPAVAHRWEFDGSHVSSRMIDGVLHLVLSQYPQLPFDMDPAAITVQSIEDYIPSFAKKDGSGAVLEEGPMVAPIDFYRPADPDGYGITTVLSVDITAPEKAMSSVAVIADPGTIYASTTALYLTDPEYDYFFGYREQTDIHKFSLSKDGAAYVSSIAVEGRLLNQFAMGEHRGQLRVATTTGEPWAWDGNISKNHVFVIGEQRGELVQVGSIENMAPGERIYSALFVGDRGFLVTFRQVDPLFTLDLSDGSAPRVAGELKIPGFSEYIHLLDEDHLLTLGRLATDEGLPLGMQLSIFDVTDFANPQQAFTHTIGTQGTYSEGEYNHKALTFYESQGLLALPVTLYETVDEREYGDYTFTGLQVYEVSSSGGIALRGQISTAPANTPYPTYWGWTRGQFIGDMVYAVTEIGLHAASIADPSTPLHELELEDVPDYSGGIFFEDVIFEDGGGFDGEISVPPAVR